MAATFSGASEASKTAGDTEIEKLHAKIGQLVVNGIFVEGVRAMSVERRRQMIERGHAGLSIVAQCRLVSISRSGTVRTFVCGRAVEHYAAMALMKRSPKMTAN